MSTMYEGRNETMSWHETSPFSRAIGKTWLGPLLWTALLLILSAGEARSDVVYEDFEGGGRGRVVIDAARASIELVRITDEAVAPSGGGSSLRLKR